MNKAAKKEHKRGQSTRQLMGLEEVTDYSLKTANGEMVYFIVKPDNLSVLSNEGVRGRVMALSNLLRGTESVRILALNSRDHSHVIRIGTQNAFSRKNFPRCANCFSRIPSTLTTFRQRQHPRANLRSCSRSKSGAARMPAARSHGWKKPARSELSRPPRDRAGHQRILAIYYQQDVTTEYFDNIDGERWVSENG